MLLYLNLINKLEYSYLMIGICVLYIIIKKYILSKDKVYKAKVLHIIDGDTIIVKMRGEKIKIRLYGIDAMELEQKPYGQIAKKYLKKITPHHIYIKVKGKDKYNRVIGELYSDFLIRPYNNINLKMIKRGYAFVYMVKGIKDIMLYKQAENIAIKKKYKIYDKNIERPYDFRKRRN